MTPTKNYDRRLREVTKFVWNGDDWREWGKIFMNDRSCCARDEWICRKNWHSVVRAKICIWWGDSEDIRDQLRCKFVKVLRMFQNSGRFWRYLFPEFSETNSWYFLQPTIHFSANLIPVSIYKVCTFIRSRFVKIQTNGRSLESFQKVPQWID
jgi:hypothetical protein